VGLARKLVVAAAVLVGTAVAGPAHAPLLATWMGAAGALTGTSTPWAVTVGPPSRTLFAGLDTNIPYTVENRGAARQFLHSARVQLRNDGVGIYDMKTNSYIDGCLVSWVHVGAIGQPVPASGAEVDPGAAVSGTVDVVFEDAPVSQDACEGLVFEVDITVE
jgi:hypothetical protein